MEGVSLLDILIWEGVRLLEILIWVLKIYRICPIRILDNLSYLFENIVCLDNFLL